LTMRIWARQSQRLKCAASAAVGYCKSMPDAVRPFERLRSRLRPACVYSVNTPTQTVETSANRANHGTRRRNGRFSSQWITSHPVIRTLVGRIVRRRVRLPAPSTLVPQRLLYTMLRYRG
jgi:hypothetical protein